MYIQTAATQLMMGCLRGQGSGSGSGSTDPPGPRTGGLSTLGSGQNTLVVGLCTSWTGLGDLLELQQGTGTIIKSDEIPDA